MVATEFKPNAVFIPAAAWDEDNDGVHADPEKCQLLFWKGDRYNGEIFTKEGFEGDFSPAYIVSRGVCEAVSLTTELDDQVFVGLDPSKQENRTLDQICLLPDVWCIKYDKTEFWSHALTLSDAIKRVFHTYVFDRSVRHHLCEMRPSYELRLINYEIDFHTDASEEEVDHATDQMCAELSNDEMFSYMHIRSVEKHMGKTIRRGSLPDPPSHVGVFKIDDLTSVTYDDAIREIEDYRRNGRL